MCLQGPIALLVEVFAALAGGGLHLLTPLTLGVTSEM